MSDASCHSDHLAIIEAQADRCVKCGLCLPHCPTYALTRDEAESPRGRIALADALARGRLPASAGLLAHLDSCLLCRRCETACPSGVAYTGLIDHSRALTLAKRPAWLRITASLLSKRRLVALGLTLARWLPAAWLPGGSGLTRAARQLAGRRVTATQSPTQTNGPRVGLFVGCVGSVIQHSVQQAAQRLLEAAGAAVVIPKGQGCCGAMHAHLGDAEQAHQLAERNQRAFATSDVDAIVSFASGCGCQLGDQAPPLPVPPADISHYLLSSGLIERLSFAPLSGKALLHTPCTLASQPGAGAAVHAVLSRIPGLTLVALDAGPACCGAAGLQLLSHVPQAQALRAPKLAAIAAADADYLLTSNPGCALHLLAGIEGPRPEVLHPVELLLRQHRSSQGVPAGG
jgi:glycolate oxidase iron-sulfur subunit